MYGVLFAFLSMCEKNREYIYVRSFQTMYGKSIPQNIHDFPNQKQASHMCEFVYVDLMYRVSANLPKRVSAAVLREGTSLAALLCQRS